MNKARRHELKKLKYKKRLIRIGSWDNETAKSPIGEHYNYTGFLNSSNPCSCFMCSNQKYKRSDFKREKTLLDSAHEQKESDS